MAAAVTYTARCASVALYCVVSERVLHAGFFTVCMARLNVRIRTRLFDSLLAQELGYFDTTKTGAVLMSCHPVHLGMDVYYILACLLR